MKRMPPLKLFLVALALVLLFSLAQAAPVDADEFPADTGSAEQTGEGEVEEPETSQDPGASEMPEETEAPVESQEPEAPPESEQPEPSEGPAASEEPEIPSDPVESDIPETPSDPIESDIPETPSDPIESDMPEIPSEPVETDEPVVPSVPVETVAPEIPSVPEVSDTPVLPSEQPYEPPTEEENPPAAESTDAPGEPTSPGISDGTDTQADPESTVQPGVYPGTKENEVVIVPSVQEGTAYGKLDSASAIDLVLSAVRGEYSEIVLMVDAQESAASIRVTVPSAFLSAIARDARLPLLIKTPLASFTFPQMALESLGDRGSTMTITVSLEDSALSVAIAIDGRFIEYVPGGFKVTFATKRTGYSVIARSGSADEGGKVLPKTVISEGTASVVINENSDIVLAENSKYFSDTAHHWAKNAIQFVSSRELFLGTGGDFFDTEGVMSHAMLITVLYRLDGSPDVETDASGSLTQGIWYSDAMAWGIQNDIISENDDWFDPNAAITREEIAVMLYNYAASLGLAGGDASLDKQFMDASSVSTWAEDAVRWVVQNKIMEGRDDGMLDAAATATRGEVATMLMRFCEVLTK